MIKKQAQDGKAAEECFVKYKIYESRFLLDKMLPIEVKDVSNDPQWQQCSDIDFITQQDGQAPVFHEVKEQLKQYIDHKKGTNNHYMNLTVEAISTVPKGEYGFTCIRDQSRLNSLEHTDCNKCAYHEKCNGWGIKTISGGRPKQKAQAPDNLYHLLEQRNELENYKDQYYIKFGDGWLHKNPYLHADWYHILFVMAYIDVNNAVLENEAVKKETDDNINEWEKTAKSGEKLIIRAPFDFFISIKHDILLSLVKKYARNAYYSTDDKGKSHYLHFLKIEDVLHEYFENKSRIVLTPLVTFVDEEGQSHDEVALGNKYFMTKSLASKVGINIQKNGNGQIDCFK